MDKQLIEACVKFLERVDLKGGEAPVFMACLEALRKEFEKVEETEEKPEEE